MISHQAYEMNQMKINSAKIINISIIFLWIGEIDIANERFQAKIMIESKWDENEIIEEYNPKIFHDPEIFIENILEYETEDTNYEFIQMPFGTTIIEHKIIKGYFSELYTIQEVIYLYKIAIKSWYWTRVRY